MFFSLLFHGGQGYFAGFKGKSSLLRLAPCDSRHGRRLRTSFCPLLGNGWGAAISDIPNNLAQNFVGMALGYVVYYAFQKERKLIHGSGATEEGYKEILVDVLEKAVSAKDRF